MSIPPELLNRLHTTLLRCEPFGSNDALEAVFVDARIGQWAADLPEASSNDKRVRATIKYLLGKRDTNDEHALVLLLGVLCEQTPPADARQQELTDLADELEREFELHPPQPAVPETSAQKFRHFLFGDTETQRAYRNRQTMLKLVHNTWIKGVLEQSLHGAALIELGMEYDPTAVDHPWDMVVQMPERPDKAVPPGTRIVDVFDDVGGSLLILGEPGSGKTTMLLELARDLIARAEQDPLQCISVVFNLSSWVVRQAPLEEWLVEELRTKYYIPKKVAQAWVKDDALLLLLDGLDEVKADTRNKCVTAINAFREQHIVPLVVCSRKADYKALTKKLHLQGGICLHSLTPAQIDIYLTSAGIETQAVRTTLKQDTVLQEMAESPLFLSIMIQAYRGKTITDLQDLATPEAHRQHLFDTYIERMFYRRVQHHTYASRQTCQRLSYLAHQMNIHAQPIFLIENLQTTWLPLKVARNTRYLARLFIMWYHGVVPGLIFGLAGLIIGRLYGLAVMLVLGMIGGMFFGLIQEIGEKTQIVEPVEIVKWSWEKARKSLPVRCSLGLLIGIVFGLIFRINAVSNELGIQFKDGLIAGLYMGTVGGLVYGLIGGLEKEKLMVKTVPNQGIWQSAKNTIGFGLYVGLFVWIATGLVTALFSRSIGEVVGAIIAALIFGLSAIPLAGLIEGINWGGRAVLIHFAIRLALYSTNRLPWHLVPFLDYCTKRIFLRKVGGGYIFIHRLLQEHFASLTPEDIERIAVDSCATA